jgi:hypothetical protein
LHFEHISLAVEYIGRKQRPEARRPVEIHGSRFQNDEWGTNIGAREREARDISEVKRKSLAVCPLWA